MRESNTPQPLLFSGSSHPQLAEEISRHLHWKLSELVIETFPDGEIGMQILENVRGRDVFFVQTIARDPNTYLMELLIFADACRRASANSIVAIIPYFGYARQDRKDRGRVPITAKLVANLLEKSGITRILTLDLHAPQIGGFFDIPVDNLYAKPILAGALQQLDLTNPVVLAPDIGSVKLAKSMAEDIDAGLAMIDKQRITAEKVAVDAIMVGDVAGKEVILVDDICSTGATLRQAAVICRERQAKKVIAVISHALLLSPYLKQHDFDLFLATNSIPLLPSLLIPRLQVVSVAKLFSQAIDCIIHHHSIQSFSASPYACV